MGKEDKEEEPEQQEEHEGRDGEGAGGGVSHFGPQLESFLLLTRRPTELRILRFVKERRETLIGRLDGNPSF